MDLFSTKSVIQIGRPQVYPGMLRGDKYVSTCTYLQLLNPTQSRVELSLNGQFWLRSLSKKIQHILRNFTCQQSNSTCQAITQEKVLTNRNVGPGMFGLGLLKEIYLAYSNHFLFKEQGLYLDTWSWPPLLYMEKTFGSLYTGLRGQLCFIIVVYYAVIKVFHLIYFLLFFIYLYVSFLFTYNQCFV